jgi:hypothetical protein
MQAAVKRAVTYADGPGFRIEILGDTHAMVEFMAKGKCRWHRYEIRLNRIHGDFELLKQKLWVIATTRAAWLQRGQTHRDWQRMALATGLLAPR